MKLNIYCFRQKDKGVGNLLAKTLKIVESECTLN